jgi:hypothetical protein
MVRISFVVVAIATLVVGCSSKKESGGGGKPAAVKLDKVGLQIDIPGEASVEKAIGSEGNMVTGSDVGALTVEETKPQTLEEAKSDASMYSPKNLKEEKLADGWALSFENTGGMGTNYFVDVRREIGGKRYKCSSTGAESERAAAVLAACKTLRK